MRRFFHESTHVLDIAAVGIELALPLFQKRRTETPPPLLIHILPRRVEDRPPLLVEVMGQSLGQLLDRPAEPFAAN